jgi:VCBS repeat-containing protein
VVLVINKSFERIEKKIRSDRDRLIDAAARLTSTIEDYGTSKLNRETQYTYDADNHLVTLTAVNAITGNQVTTFIYGTRLEE